jgi:hypothetical protein
MDAETGKQLAYDSPDFKIQKKKKIEIHRYLWGREEKNYWGIVYKLNSAIVNNPNVHPNALSKRKYWLWDLVMTPAYGVREKLMATCGGEYREGESVWAAWSRRKMFLENIDCFLCV